MPWPHGWHQQPRRAAIRQTFSLTPRSGSELVEASKRKGKAPSQEVWWTVCNTPFRWSQIHNRDQGFCPPGAVRGGLEDTPPHLGAIDLRPDAEPSDTRLI